MPMADTVTVRVQYSKYIIFVLMCDEYGYSWATVYDKHMYCAEACTGWNRKYNSSIPELDNLMEWLIIWLYDFKNSISLQEWIGQYEGPDL